MHGRTIESGSLMAWKTLTFIGQYKQWFGFAKCFFDTMSSIDEVRSLNNNIVVEVEEQPVDEINQINI